MKHFCLSKSCLSWSHKPPETQSRIIFLSNFAFGKIIPKWETLAMQEGEKHCQHFCLNYYVILLSFISTWAKQSLQMWDMFPRWLGAMSSDWLVSYEPIILLVGCVFEWLQTSAIYQPVLGVFFGKISFGCVFFFNLAYITCSLDKHSDTHATHGFHRILACIHA